MSPTWFSTDPFTPAELAQNDRFYLAFLHGLLPVGAALAADLPVQAKAQPAKACDLAAAFDRVASAMRRTVLLARSLAEPPPRPAGHRTMRTTTAPAEPPPHPPTDQAPGAGPSNRPDPVERLEQLDRLDDISGPVPEVIAGIARDLGVPSPFAAPNPPGARYRHRPAAPYAEPPSGPHRPPAHVPAGALSDEDLALTLLRAAAKRPDG